MPSDTPWRMKNRIMDYPWGSHTAIAELLGEPSPSNQPQAEMWMGAHPKAPSLVEVDDKWIPLSVAISNDPAGILGDDISRRYLSRLPFLFKVLAASRPLSIQAHPNQAQAREGFAAENRLGIPLDASRRNFRDESSKPELLVALSPFQVLCGFRKIQDIIQMGNRFFPKRLGSDFTSVLKPLVADGLKAFFISLMSMDEARRKAVIKEALAAAKPHAGTDPVSYWILALQRHHPFDIGVLSPIFLNLLRLESGEGIFLNPGILHSYLEGTGIELMGNSDNVIRGGLTPKYIDVDTLIRIVNFRDYAPALIHPVENGPCEKVYRTPAEMFCLHRVDASYAKPCRWEENAGVAIFLCVFGSGKISEEKRGEGMTFRKGDSFLVPANVTAYCIEGDATLYRASAPIS